VEETINFTNDKIWKSIIANSKQATNFYRDVFGCIPDDTVTCGQEISKLADQGNINLYHERRNTLKGHAVEFPLDFMKD
jgi:phospholipase D1/2